MDDRRVIPRRDFARGGIVRAVLGLALVAILLFGAVAIYRTYTQRYTVSTEGDTGVAVAKIVEATLREASDLKVSTLTGTVQSTASDTRGFGWITSKRVMKAPFSVDYFVDVSALSPRDFIWDASTKTLTVRAPGVRLGKVNVDEANTYLDRTQGVFVTRNAMAALQREASANAASVAHAEAMTPERVAEARRNARAAIMRLFAAPLAAAGLDARVEVRFAGEGARGEEHWDVSRSLEEVLGNT